MGMWLDAMSPLQRVFAYIALAGSFALIVQFLLLLIGIGHTGDADAPDTSGLDADHDTDLDHDGINDYGPGEAHLDHDALRPFTLRGAIAFLAIFGWVGLILLKLTAPAVLAVMLSVGAGMTAMLLMAMAFRAMFNLQQSGNIDFRNALGGEGEVYITIPKARTGRGKVSLIVQERLAEIDAVTDESNAISTGQRIVVVDVEGDTLVVEAREAGDE